MGKKCSSRKACKKKASEKTTKDKYIKQIHEKDKEIARLKLQQKTAAAATKAFYDIMKARGFSGRKDPIKQIRK